MPLYPKVTPDHHVPQVGHLLAVVQRCPGATLRQVAAAIWPDLAWSGGTGADSATGRTRHWPTGARASAARWLADEMRALEARGLVRSGPRDRGEVDTLAGLTWIALGAAAAAAPAPGAAVAS